MEITHVDLNKLAERLETSFQRDVDGLRRDLCDRIEQVRSDLEKQGESVDVSATSLAAVTTELRVLRHDFNNHINAHPGPTADRKAKASGTDKGFVAGAVAVAALMGGFAAGTFEFLFEFWKRLKP